MEENEQVIDLEDFNEDDLLDLTSPECLQAIASLGGGFKPYWTGQQLLKYYEERDLSFEQMRAMVKAENEKGAAYLKNHAVEAEEFLKGGEAPPCPSMESMFLVVDQLFPETQRCPVEKLLARLEKQTGSKFKGPWTLSMDKKDTGISIRSIENLWCYAIKFNHDAEASLDIVEALVLKKLGLARRPWWRFWG